MSDSRRDPFMCVDWTDPVTGCKGYLAIDRLVQGLAGGGLRMRAGGTLREAEDLARTMSLKMAIHNIPVGGAKGVIDFDSRDPRARDVLQRFVRAFRPLLDSYWITAEDLGVNQGVLDQVFASEFKDLGLPMSVHAALKHSKDPQATLDRMNRALALASEGVQLADLVAGYGVASATKAGCAHLGLRPDATRAVVQGFGAAGGACARYLSRQGLKVVGIVDARGSVVNPAGLDVEALLQTRNAFGEIDRSSLNPGSRELSRDDWLAIETEVLVPAAISYALTESNWRDVNARLVVEAANNPTTAPAALGLHERGVVVVPDFVANSGAAAWWMSILLDNVEPTVERSFKRIDSAVFALTSEVLKISTREGRRPFDVAAQLAQRNLEANAVTYGEERATTSATEWDETALDPGHQDKKR